MNVPDPTGRPMYDLLANHGALLEAIRADPKAFEERVVEEMREALTELGPRVALAYAERMDNAQAVFEEFAP